MDRTKWLYLDIDGCLNAFARVKDRSFTKMLFPDTGPCTLIVGIEPYLLDRLTSIIENSNNKVNIVISSSWRLDNVLYNMKAHGFKYINNIVGRTLRYAKYRGNQILQHMKDNDISVNDILVIEDDWLDVCGEYCNVIPSSVVVKPIGQVGLSEENVKEAIAILNN